MTPANTAAASRRSGAAARREKAAEEKTKKWRGLELTLPAELPGTFAFDLEEIEFSGASGPASALHAIRLLVGDEQFALIRAKVVDEAIPMSEIAGALRELTEEIMSTYGVSSGESAASADS